MMNNRKCNLLFLPYTFTNGGGAEKILQMLVNSIPLDKYNINIQEVESFGKDLKLNEGIKLNQSFWGQSPLEKLFYQYNYFLLLYFSSLLKNVFNLNNYDAVITYNYQLPSFMLPAFNKQKKIAWFHTDIYDLQNEQLKWEKNKQKKVWEYADRIVTISNYSLQSLKDVFPEFINKSAIIHNGMDFSYVVDCSKEECDFDFNGSPVLVCVGRIDERKNFQYAVKILAELKNQNVDCRLLIVGEGNLKDDVIKLAEYLNVQDKIFFAGFQTNPYKYIARSKLLCVTSLAEGWPTVVMESMALGIPFITTPVAGASDELADNGNCGLVAGYDEKEYAAAVSKILNDKDLYERMSNNCKKNVLEYTDKKYAENFIKLLNEIEPKEKKSKIHSNVFVNFFSYLLYFIFYILNIGEIVFRFQIIIKRLKEKRLVKVLKNCVYFTGILILFPIISFFKLFLIPSYIKRLLKNK